MQCLQRKNAQLMCLKLFRILSNTLRREPLLHMSSIGVQHVMQHIHMIQHRTGTLGHAVQRILRNMHINAGLALDQLIQTGVCNVTVLESRDKWFGVTYKEDKPLVVRSFRELIDAGVYKERLFD